MDMLKNINFRDAFRFLKRKSKKNKKVRKTSLIQTKSAVLDTAVSIAERLNPTRAFTSQDLDCLAEALILSDTEHSQGELSVVELGVVVMQAHGFTPSLQQVAGMVRSVDATGTVDINEFIKMMVTRQEEDSTAKEDDMMRATFKVFDRNGDGLISEEELRLTMNSLGEPLSKAELMAMIAEADMDGDGKINFQEFSRLMANSPELGASRDV